MQLGLVTAKVVPSTELEIRVESHKNLKKNLHLCAKNTNKSGKCNPAVEIS